jgi:probable HAF family extracellular repeat protein
MKTKLLFLIGGLLLTGCIEAVSPSIDEQVAFSSAIRLSTTGVPIQVIDLEGCEPLAINDGGAIVGQCTTGLKTTPLVWFPDFGRIELGFAGHATDINNRGEVVGQRYTGLGTRAFLWTRGAGVMDLPTLGGPYNIAEAINDRGTVVGESEDTLRNFIPYKWTRDGGLVVLEDSFSNVPSLLYYRAMLGDINNVGRIVGLSIPYTGLPHALLWLPFDGFIDLGELTRNYGEIWGIAGINELGQIAGVIGGIHPTDSSYIFVWTQQKGITVVAPGKRRRNAVGIDDQGVVAGTYLTLNSEQHAFVWTQGRTTDLGTLGGPGSYALGFNDRGVVLGTATDERNNRHTVLWHTR